MGREKCSCEYKVVLDDDFSKMCSRCRAERSFAHAEEISTYFLNKICVKTRYVCHVFKVPWYHVI